MNSITHISFLLTIALLLSAVLMSGCSSSSDSQSFADTQNETSADTGPDTDDVASLSDDDVSNDVAVIVDSTSNTAEEPVDNTSNATEQESVSTGPVVLVPSSVPDPMVQNRTQVNFEITVPVYQSNALQVRLFWGDIDMTARWVGDELWSVTTDFPTNTEFPLRVIFSDKNGALTLASFETLLRTGENSGESIQINADQFDSASWDDDNDNLSNLNEVLGGTDPLAQEQLEIRDSYAYPFRLALRVAFFEQALPAERPYFESAVVLPPTDFNPPYSESETTIELDVFGTGRYVASSARQTPSSRFGTRRVGTRTNTGDSLNWTGAYSTFDTSDGVSVRNEFSFEHRVLDVSRRRQNGTSSLAWRDNSEVYDQDITYNVTGRVVNDSPQCEVTSGTIVEQFSGFTRADRADSLETTLTKGPQDDYWSVSVATLDGDVVEQYSVQNLSAEFYCGFADQ